MPLARCYYPDLKETTTMTTTDTEARKILQAARFVVMRARPYLGTAASAITFVERPGIGTMACDQYWRVYYDPATVRQWGVQNTACGILHELGHLVRAHHARAKALGVTAETAREANIAQDCAINESLIFAGDKLRGIPADTFDLLETDSTPAKLGLPAEKAWEEYYAILVEKKKQQQQNDGGGRSQPSQGGQQQGQSSGKGQPSQSGHGAGCKCGSGATGVPEAWDDAAPQQGAENVAPGLHEGEVRAIQHATAQAVAEYEAKHGRGSAAGFGAWAASALTPPVVPWQQVLRQAVRTAVQRRRGAADYSYSRPSRRASAVQGVVLPSMHESVPQIAVVLDTSASMGSQRLQAAVAEIEGVCRMLSAQVRLVTVDAVVQGDVAVQSAKGLKVKGFGGTDMNKGIRHVVESRRKKPCDAIIVLTDGDTPMARREDVPRDVRLIYCLIGAYCTGTPSWATTVTIPAA